MEDRKHTAREPITLRPEHDVRVSASLLCPGNIADLLKPIIGRIVPLIQRSPMPEAAKTDRFS